MFQVSQWIRSSAQGFYYRPFSTIFSSLTNKFEDFSTVSLSEVKGTALSVMRVCVCAKSSKHCNSVSENGSSCSLKKMENFTSMFSFDQISFSDFRWEKTEANLWWKDVNVGLTIFHVEHTKFKIAQRCNEGSEYFGGLRFASFKVWGFVTPFQEELIFSLFPSGKFFSLK